MKRRAMHYVPKILLEAGYSITEAGYRAAKAGTSTAESQAAKFAKHLVVHIDGGVILNARLLPPKGLLIDMLTPPAHAEEALANISARYDHWVAKYGKRRANQIFYAQCLGVVMT